MQRNEGSFDNQFYYEENVGFITKFVGSFKTETGEEVAIFERIQGEDFCKYNAGTTSQQCRLLAQAATALTISHEAGCINADVKPGNMMVDTSGKEPLLKLIDQGGIVDLTQAIDKTYYSFTTPYYSAPEIYMYLKGQDNTGLYIAPYLTTSTDVFSLGVSILDKLPESNGKTNIINRLETFQNENERKALLYNPKNKQDFQENVMSAINNANDLFGTPEESKFVRELLADCLAYEPKDRISAAQAAEILQVFSTYLEAKESNPNLECPNYNDVKVTATKDCPKGVPIALRKMLFSKDASKQENAVKIIKKLADADPSYKATPSYGAMLLLSSDPKDNNEFKNWAANNPQTYKELKDRIYIQGDTRLAQQDMPVPQNIYNFVQSIKFEKYTPAYGINLLLSSPAGFQTWAVKYPQSLQVLKNITYIQGQRHSTDQAVPVSRSVYREIQTTGLQQNSPDYGRALLQSLDNEAFQNWAKDFSEAADVLK